MSSKWGSMEWTIQQWHSLSHPFSCLTIVTQETASISIMEKACVSVKKCTSLPKRQRKGKAEKDIMKDKNTANVKMIGSKCSLVRQVVLGNCSAKYSDWSHACIPSCKHAPRCTFRLSRVYLQTHSHLWQSQSLLCYSLPMVLPVPVNC